MISKIDKNQERKRRHLRVRNKVSGTAAAPRLCVYRSLNHIYAQIIDDTVAGKTKSEEAKLVGELLAKKALEKGIETVVFDRGGYLYTGRVASLADGAREGGLKF